MITREEQRNKYENDKRYHADPDSLDQSTSNRYSLRNRFGAYFEFRKQSEIVSLLNKHKIRLKDKTILDIGCHKGLHCNLFAQVKGSSKDIYGVDFIPSFIKQAKEINKSINFSQGDVYGGLEFKNEYFDLISAIYFFNCIPEKDHKKIASEISSKVKKGGYVIIFDFLNSGFARVAQNVAHRGRKYTRLPSINDKVVKRMFPEFRIVESKKIINVLSYRLSSISYSWAALMDICLPKEYYIALLKKR